MHIMRTKIKQLIHPEQLGHTIKCKRRSSGLTQAELANSIGLHHSQVVRIEQGRMATLNGSVRKICTFLDISLELVEAYESSSICARVERLVREAPESSALLLSTVELLERVLLKNGSNLSNQDP